MNASWLFLPLNWLFWCHYTGEKVDF